MTQNSHADRKAFPGNQKLHPMTRDLLNQHVRSARLYLRQVRAAGNLWSTGKEILTGNEVRKLRQDLVHEIISKRDRLATNDQGREPGSGRIWRNFVSLQNLRMRNQIRAKETPTTILEAIRHAALEPAHDMGQAERKLVSLRTLRHKFPHEIDPKSAPDHAATDREKHHIVAAMKKKVWILTRDVEVQDWQEDRVIVPKDTILDYSTQYGFHTRIGGTLQEFRSEDVRKARRRDFARLGLSKEESVDCDGPGF